MSKFLHSFTALLLVCMSPLMAQQLPDSGFENWDGAQFANNAQPKYWNFSNVSQMGVEKNFAHKTTGRSGSALKIQDQWVGAMGIGATSPGYVALGHPWAYVSSLTTIEDATAGTYGGISWTYRPDSMVVWIKRYYDKDADGANGDHVLEENYNLLFYSWSGTSKGATYKAKNGTCTDISSDKPAYCVDEESDIRQTMDKNECGTLTQAKQIAEGWVYEKKKYANWTRISVPIFYLSDDAPTKCNVILSAGNYPNFRANTGQYAGSTMDVDDIQMIYSSKIQKLYVNGREWKAFDPNSTDEQTYSLGLGATEIPEIFAVRGAGRLTAPRGNKYDFPGRRLSSSECSIQMGQVDGDPTIITVTAPDGSSTTTYTIKFVSQASNNARLSDIKVNGESVNGFNAYLTSYNVELPYGTTEVPEVTATAQDASATVKVTQAPSVNGQASILVTAGDGTQLTYTIDFSVAALTDVTLRNIFLDGQPLTGFQPSKSNYSVSLPLGTTEAPTVTWESAYPDGVQSIQLLNNTLDGGAQIQVSIPGTSNSKTYKLTYKIEASSYSYLQAIMLDGEPLADFQPEQTVYAITLPLGTTTLPAITWTQGDAYQTVKLVEGGVDGVTRIEVAAASGATTIYRLQFRTEKSTNNALAAIMLDGELLENFNADTLSYHVLLPAGTSALPQVTYTQGDNYQTVSLTINQTLLTARLVVAAGDGSTRQYIIYFEIQKSENAFLKMIYLDGAELAGFEAQTLDYSLVWNESAMPKITVLADEGQMVTISAPSSYGTARIVVTPEEGTPNVYLIHFVSPDQVVLPAFPVDSFPVDNNALLSAIYLDGKPFEAFNPNVFDYIDSLAWRTTQVPAVVPVAATRGQVITVEHGAVGQTTTIRVVAADGVTAQTYRIFFPVAKSSSTELLSIEIDGVNFNFDPNQYEYTVSLPYGTKAAPALTVERALPEQSLLITESPIGQASTVVVTAEDGTQATYTINFAVEYPAVENKLLAIIIDGVGALDLTQGNDFTIDLPYGASSLEVVSVTKAYPEQEVQIIEGGVLTPTTITVKSLNPSEGNTVYTITPNVNPYDPAQLLDIKIDGTSLAQFQPGIYNYVISVTGETPVVTYTAQDNADVTEDASSKHVIYDVEVLDEFGAVAFAHRYMVTFFYPNDISFDLGFNNWEDFKNDGTGKTGSRPKGWNAPITATTTGDAGTYDPSSNTAGVTSPKKEGAKAAKLETTYLLTSAESMPGFLSLSQPTVAVGKWLLWVYEIHSSLSFGDPITFRNTPDQIQIDYNLSAYNRVTGWRFIYSANGQKQINHAQQFSSMAKNTWYTLTNDLTYSDDYIPATLEILISSAQSDNLEDYYISSDGISTSKRHTSTMYVDNLRFNYNSALSNVTVNGTTYSFSGNAASATIDAETQGLPTVLFGHQVHDQMPVVTWSDEVDGVRTASIRNYGENLSYTDYTLTVTRPKSANTACTYSVEGNDLKVTKGSAYQTIAISKNDTAFVILVTAESGAKQTYYAAFEKAGGSSSSQHVTTVEAESTISGQSTARLINVEEDPILNYDREYALDSVSMIATDTCYLLTVYGQTSDTTYVIRRNPSSNALLASLSVNQQSVPDFFAETFDYTVSLPSLDSFEAIPQDSAADVRTCLVPIDDENAAIYVLVTAADGKTQNRYSVLANIRTLSSDAYLLSISADDHVLSDFASDKYDYLVELPAHSLIPLFSSVACPGATVEASIVSAGSSAIVTFTVTSEDESVTRDYIVGVKVLPSEVCTLSDLIVGGVSLEGFSSDQTEYSIELPYGTTTMPDVDYVLTDRNSKAEQSETAQTVQIFVMAEDSIHSTTYIVTFTIAKSNNSALSSISLDGEQLASFYVDDYDYEIQLPYGSSEPEVTAVAADTTATVTIEGGVITVVAGDGVSTSTYTVTFTILPSTNANLKAIFLNSTLQSGFVPDTYEYNDTITYGAAMPEITWLTADEQQKVDTTWIGDNELQILVTAGDGVTTSEYSIIFFHQLSTNCRLKDLKVRGITVTGFSPDSVVYLIEYPIGTREEQLCTEANIKAIPEDDDATITLSSEGSTIQILVTAPDGKSKKVYVIEQVILLSSEARLQMIWLDGVEVRDYMMDSLTYTIKIVPGSPLPMITAQPLDTLATWEPGLEIETENGKTVQVFGEAQDGTLATYTLNFEYANWTATGTTDTDDYLFFYAGGGQYKAVTISIGVQIAIYDMAGRLLTIGEVPTADPSDVVVEVDDEGNQILVEALPSAAGYLYTPPVNEALFYVFFDSKTKRIAKGGKFRLAAY